MSTAPAKPAQGIGAYIAVTAAYWAFMLTDGALRMLVLLHFHTLGFSAVQLAYLFLLYEFMGVVTNLSTGWIAARFGLTSTLYAGLSLQIAALAAIVWGLKRIGGRMARPLWTRPRAADLLRGPWPLLLGAIALALLNWATLAISGGPWGVTWGFTIWGAKAAQLLGWDPSTSAYWTVPWRAGALAEPLLAGVTSVMNFGILLGAAAAATLAARMRPDLRLGLRPTVAAIVGGLMLGYGARLAYGCNIGAFFSGVASTSLHGWAWIVAALAGNLIGVRLRPWFRL